MEITDACRLILWLSLKVNSKEDELLLPSRYSEENHCRGKYTVTMRAKAKSGALGHLFLGGSLFLLPGICLGYSLSCVLCGIIFEE
jgi:hypothetical protein